MKNPEDIEVEGDSEEVLFLVGNKWQNSFDIVEQRTGIGRRSKGDQRDDHQQKEKQASKCESPK